MNLTIINNSSDTFSYSVVTIGPESSLTVDPSNWFSLLQDTSFVSDIKKNNIYLNDGMQSYFFEDAVIFLQNAVTVFANKDVTGSSVITTQYEMNDKDLKLARSAAQVDNNGKALAIIKIPGIFGSKDGRYIAGGYAISEDYNKDDFVTVWVEDTDRLICAANGLPTDGTGDATMKESGYPQYPIVKSYTDDDAPAENQGWYFWPLVQGNSLPAAGECEVDPVGGYGFIPAGLYVKIQYQRPTGVISGSVRINFWWGKKE